MATKFLLLPYYYHSTNHVPVVIVPAMFDSILDDNKPFQKQISSILIHIDLSTFKRASKLAYFITLIYLSMCRHIYQTVTYFVYTKGLARLILLNKNVCLALISIYWRKLISLRTAEVRQWTENKKQTTSTQGLKGSVMRTFDCKQFQTNIMWY